MSTLIATDLDQTLIYSRRAIARWGGGSEAIAAVEQYQGAESSFMIAGAFGLLADVAQRALLVPATTRTVEQLARVRMPGGPSRFAIAANGGVLLVDGVPDQDWARTVAGRVAGSIPLSEVAMHAQDACSPEWTDLVRTANDLFCYAVLDLAGLPATFVADEAAWAAERGWHVSFQGRKLYWVPQALTKSAAVAEVVERTGSDRVLAAGDSLLDADLLAAADAAMIARHGELFESGWSAPHVRVSEQVGIRAGEEVVRWFSSVAGDSVGTAPSRPDPDRRARPRPARTAAS